MDREMLKKIVKLVIPTIIEYSLQVLTNYADYIMVGSLGVTASAAIGITTEITYLLKGAVNALGIGVLAYISAAIGAKKTDRIKTASVQAVYTSVAVGIVLPNLTHYERNKSSNNIRSSLRYIDKKALPSEIGEQGSNHIHLRTSRR